jgi:hypothetical protein
MADRVKLAIAVGVLSGYFGPHEPAIGLRGGL